MRNIYIILSLFVFTLSLKAQVSEQEFQALKAIYIATGGNNWTNRTGWENINTTATKDDVKSTWFGISAIEDGHLTNLNLWGNNLAGVIPNEIGNLQYLTYLNLGNNNLEGPLPQSLKNLTKMNTISVSECKINGPFPFELLNNWPLLRSFYAGSCGITGTIPDIFGSTPLLEDLWIYNNKLEGTLPPSINKLNLSDFNCSDNKFEGTLPKLDSCKKTYRLGFSYNHFSGSIPESYGQLKNLQQLNLSSNNLSGYIPDGFFTPALSLLFIDENYFTFQGVELIFEKINALQSKYYTSSKNIPLLQQEITLNENEILTLNATTLSVYNLGGNNNRYKWFRNNVEVYSGISPIYNIPSVRSANAGVYRFEVTNTVVTDLKLYSENITVTINHINNPPTNITLSKENADENFTGVIGTLSATDPDIGDTHTFALVTGDGTTNKDNNKFSISGNQLSISIKVDFEIIKTLNILIGVTDNYGGTFAKAFTITVNNLNEAPVFIGQVANKSIDETVANGFTVLNLTAQDPENTPIIFSLTSGNENGAFGINGDKLIVIDNTKLNYNVKNSYSLTVSASDGTLNSTTTIIVNLNKINHAPTNITISKTSVDENLTGLVGTLSATDPDIGDTYTFTLVTGDGITNKDNNKFSISGNQLSINTKADFELIKSLNILIGVIDNNGGTFAKAFTIMVNNVNEAPNFIGQDTIKTIDETAANGLIVFNLNANDPENNPITFSITQGDDNGAFGINGNKLIVKDNAKLDFNVKSSYSLIVRASDGTLSTTCTLALKLNYVVKTAINDLPTFSVTGIVYPNPSKGDFWVSGLQFGEKIKIISLTGELIFHKTAIDETEEINLPNLKRGSYFVIIETDNDRKVQKIIKL